MYPQVGCGCPAAGPLGAQTIAFWVYNPEPKLGTQEVHDYFRRKVLLWCGVEGP